jgi:adenosylcobyric acid synthase
VESPQPEISGLGLLAVDTLFEPVKATHQAEAQILGGPGWLATLPGEMLQGYEIHMGHTNSQQPWLEITQRSGEAVALADGAIDATGQVWGCYLHGLFANETLRRAWLASLGWCGARVPTRPVTGLQAALNTLAAQVEASLDMPRLEAIIWGD